MSRRGPGRPTTCPACRSRDPPPGLSGGGKTAAAKLFEDLGYMVVDNLPGELLTDVAELVVGRTRRASS